MSEFCIQVINPNTSPEMTHTIAMAARNVASSGQPSCQLSIARGGIYRGAF